MEGHRSSILDAIQAPLCRLSMAERSAKKAWHPDQMGLALSKVALSSHLGDLGVCLASAVGARPCGSLLLSQPDLLGRRPHECN